MRETTLAAVRHNDLYSKVFFDVILVNQCEGGHAFKPCKLKSLAESNTVALLDIFLQRPILTLKFPRGFNFCVSPPESDRDIFFNFAFFLMDR